MEMPKPGPEHAKLRKLVGSWKGDEKIHPSPWAPEGATATGRIVNRQVMSGFAVVQDYVQERDGQKTFEGHGVFTWDAPRKAYVMTWWDSTGMPPNVYVGNFDGDVLTMTTDHEQGRSRTIFDFREKDRYAFKMDVSPDGKAWHLFMEGRYTRSG